MRVRVLLVTLALALILWAVSRLASLGQSSEQEELSELQRRIDRAREKIGRKRGTERVLSTEIAAYSRRIDRLQGKITALTGRQQRVQADLDAKRDELERLRSMLRRERARLVRLRKRLIDTRIALSNRLVEIYKAQKPDAVTVILNSDGFADLIEHAIRRGRHTVAVELRRTPARVRTRAARTITSLLGTFTTRYPCCQPRVTNIRRIAKAVDGAVVLAGERFSLNHATGERTRGDGYVPAPFIADGKIVESVGGGVSQFSTTLYNAAYFAGLRIDAHRPHSFYIDRYPPGREATLNFPDIDLAWTNDTSSPVLIRTATDATSVVVSLYGADDGRRVRSQSGDRTPLPSGDFQITVTRVLRYRGGRIVRQPYTTRYDRPPPPE